MLYVPFSAIIMSFSRLFWPLQSSWHGLYRQQQTSRASEVLALGDSLTSGMAWLPRE